jgi:hypothetical protein
VLQGFHDGRLWIRRFRRVEPLGCFETEPGKIAFRELVTHLVGQMRRSMRKAAGRAKVQFKVDQVQSSKKPVQGSKQILLVFICLSQIPALARQDMSLEESRLISRTKSSTSSNFAFVRYP